MPRHDRAFGHHFTKTAKGNKRRVRCREKTRQNRYADKVNSRMKGK